jgi:CRP/FNR family transcriptional regulator
MIVHDGVCGDCAQRRVGFMSRLPKEALDRTLCVMRRGRFPPGFVLGRMGEVPEAVFAIQTGGVKLVGVGPRGHPRIVDLLGPGDLVGVCGVFGRRLAFDAVAVGEIEACHGTTAAFKGLLASNASVAMGLADHLSCVAYREAERLRGLGRNTALERVAAFLVDGRLPRVGENRVILPLRRRELAALLGIAPETVARSLTRLVADGLISVKGREITILDDEGLIDRADGGGEGDGGDLVGTA